MDDDSARTYRKPSPAKLSRTPSWVLLGFVLGVGFMWLIPAEQDKQAKPVASPAAKPAEPAKPKVPAKRRLSDIEAVFEAWGKYAVWDQNRTEVALWNADHNAYADFYEVLREDGALYFRSIPALTRPLIAHGSRPEAPLVFTETPEMRQEWLRSRGELVPAHALPPNPPPAEENRTP